MQKGAGSREAGSGRWWGMKTFHRGGGGDRERRVGGKVDRDRGA